MHLLGSQAMRAVTLFITFPVVVLCYVHTALELDSMLRHAKKLMFYYLNDRDNIVNHCLNLHNL